MSPTGVVSETEPCPGFWGSSKGPRILLCSINLCPYQRLSYALLVLLSSHTMGGTDYMSASSYSGRYGAELIETAARITAPGKGILAADESTGTIGKRVNFLSNRQKRGPA